MKNKLSSQRGASLSIALLLFLVCAVLGSVVLKTATATTGRLSGLEEADQRYYSVNSAANLFINSLDGQTVHIERARQTESSTTSVYKTDKYNITTQVSTTTSGSISVPICLIYQNDTRSIAIDEENDYKSISDTPSDQRMESTLLISAAKRFIFGYNEAEGDSLQPQEIWDHTTPASYQNKVVEIRTYTLDHQETDFGYLDVKVEESLRGDGTIIIDIYNISEDQTDSNVYHVSLTFAPQISNRTGRNVEDSSKTTSKENTTTETTTTTVVDTEILQEFRYTAVTWNLKNVEKVGQ